MRRPICRAAPLLLLLLTVGCAGSASMHFTSLNAQAIDPPPAEVLSFSGSACYWWIDEAGELNLALHVRWSRALMGPLAYIDAFLWLVPGTPPAGSGRDYAVNHAHVRVLWNSAMQNVRFSCYAGMLSMIRDGTAGFRGSLRLMMHSHPELQLLGFLPQRLGPMLCFGKFRAVNDPARGRAIQARCEADGWTRTVRRSAPASRPVANPP